MKSIMAGLLILVAAAPLGFSAQKAGKSSDTLTPGVYTAKVKAMVCEACASKIEETMKNISGIERVSADREKTLLHFTVKPDAKVRKSQLQKALKASAREMGMGADYTLSDFKKTSGL